MLGAELGNTLMGGDDLAFYDEVFQDADDADYRPVADSWLDGRPSSGPVVAVDVDGTPRTGQTIGAWELP